VKSPLIGLHHSNIHYEKKNAFFCHSKAASAAKDDLNAKKTAPPPTGALIISFCLYLHVNYYSQYVLAIRQTTEFRMFVIAKLLSSTKLGFHQCF